VFDDIEMDFCCVHLVRKTCLCEITERVLL
jgi:hypothetical protein